MYIIYCHTNKTTSRSYVGFTKLSLEGRWSNHLKDARNGSTYKFHRSIRKHGTSAWSHDVICEGVTTLELAKQLEWHFIEMLGTYERGYNMTMGGDGGTICSLEQRQAQSLRMRGRKLGQLTRTKMRAYALARPAEHNARTTEGYKRWLSSHPEHLLKMGALHSKRVVKCDMQGNELEAFQSVSAASKALGLSCGNIASVARGNRNQCGGFSWKYLEQDNDHDK